METDYFAGPVQRARIHRRARWCGRLAVLIAFASAWHAACAPAHANGSPDIVARINFDAGKDHYREGRYQAAIAAFERAATARPSPVLHFNIGLCYEKLDQREAAVAAYQRYLKEDPYAQNRADVEQRIAGLTAPRSPSPAAPGTVTGSAGASTAGALRAPVPATGPATAPGSQPVASPTSQPVSVGQRPAAGAPPVHEALLPRAAPAPPTPGAPNRPSYPPAPGREEGPVYKEWWFWTAIVAGAVIAGFIIGTAATRNTSSQ